MKLPTWTLAFLPLFLLAPAMASGQVEGLYGKSYALVVGVDEYPHPEWPDLPFARKDAQAIARLLRAQGFDEVVPLYDEQATRAAIISALEDRIAPKLQAEDRVLVFFSGHGTTKSFAGQEYGYVVPHDGTDTSATWLSMTALREMSQKLGTAKHHLFIFDSCFGGSFATKSGSTAISRSYPDYIQEVARRSARQFVTAGGRDQKVRAAGPHGYSFFTGYLLEALEEGLAETDGDGYITVLELAQYLQSRAANDHQTPGFGDLPGHGLGAFLFSAPRRPAPAAETPKPSAASVASLGLKGSIEIIPIEARQRLVADVRLRDSPSASAAAVADLARGSEVWVAGRVKEGDWLLVENGAHRGYVLGRAVAPVAELEHLDPTPLVSSLPPDCEGPEQCYKQGGRYYNGKEVSRDYGKAAVSFFRACAQSESKGCTTLGHLYEEGLGIAQDYQKARELYTHGCDGRDSLGCTALGILYKQGWGVTKDYGRARQLLKQGCEGGNASGCTGAGVLYQNGLGGTRDYQKARELYEQGCEGGDSGGCNNLGVVYMKGLGVTKDYQRAHDLYKAGCDDSSSVGCYNLAVSYHKGHGVEKDPTLALELYKKACIEGDERACALYERLSRTSQP